MIAQPLNLKRNYHQTAAMGVLPSKIKEKLHVASYEESSFNERTEALSWIVDNFRQTMHTFYQDNGIYDDISPSARTKILYQVEHIVKAAKNALFELHRQKKQGKIMSTRNEEFTKEVAFFKKNWMNVYYQNEMLSMISIHNGRVDQFCQKYHDKLPQGIEQMLRLKELQPDKLHSKPVTDQREKDLERLKSMVFMNFKELPKSEQEVLFDHRERQNEKFWSTSLLQKEAQSFFEHDLFMVS